MDDGLEMVKILPIFSIICGLKEETCGIISPKYSSSFCTFIKGAAFLANFQPTKAQWLVCFVSQINVM